MSEMWYNGSNGSVSGTNVAKRKQSDKNNSLDKWLKKFDASWTYAQQNYHQKWEDNNKLYNNTRVKQTHPGVIKTFVPMVNSSVNTIVAALFNSNPSIRYVPNYDDQEQNTAVLSEMYADFARKDGWVQKNKINGRQGIITGNMFTYYEWQSDKSGGFVHKTNVPARDMVIDPQSTGPENWRYVGRRFFASKKSLESETIYDFKSESYRPRYSNLDEVTPGTNSENESDKQVKDRLLGTTAPDDKDIIEIIEMWTRKKVVVVANRNTIIEERENPHYALEKSLYEQRKTEHELTRILQLEATGEDIGEFDEDFDEDTAGLLPFAHGRFYQDISLPYSSSDVDIIADQQELLNDLTELNLEAILYQLYPEKTLDPKYSTWVDDLSPAPGKVYPLPANAMNWTQPPTIPANAFNERINIKDEIRESIAVSQISKGVSSSADQTATEIKAQVGQADNRISEKAQTLANDFFFQEAKIVLKLVQLYAGDDLWVRTITDAGVDFKQVNPGIFMGEYTPMVTLETTQKLEQYEKQEAYTKAFQMIIADPNNNLDAAKRIMYHKMMPDLTNEEIEQIITPAAPNPNLPSQGAGEPSLEGGSGEPLGDTSALIQGGAGSFPQNLIGAENV